MEKPRWSTKFFKRNILIKKSMKVQIELFGASREFSNQNFLEFDIKSDSHVIILIHLHKSNLFAKRRLISLLYNIPMHVNDFTNQIQISSFKKIIELETYN